MTFKKIVQSFKNQQVMIVGDVMLDRYMTGAVTRISPEAPVPVMLHHATEDRLGGAANVALNVQALGGVPILCSVVGADADGAVFASTLRQLGIADTGLVFSKNRKTTVKTRVLGNNQQMLRIDHEDTHDLDEAEERALLEKITDLLQTGKCQVMILQDYNKGVLSSYLIEQAIFLAKKAKVLTAVDPKQANFFAYQGVDLFKPNLKEIRDSMPFSVLPTLESLRAAGAFVEKKLKNHLTMITLSEKGLFLGQSSGAKLYPTKTRTIADVSGAGDTVISIAAMGLAAGLDLDTIATLSNLAGGQVCEFPGVVPVRVDLLQAEYKIQISQITDDARPDSSNFNG